MCLQCVPPVDCERKFAFVTESRNSRTMIHQNTTKIFIRFESRGQFLKIHFRCARVYSELVRILPKVKTLFVVFPVISRTKGGGTPFLAFVFI